MKQVGHRFLAATACGGCGARGEGGHFLPFSASSSSMRSWGQGPWPAGTNPWIDTPPDPSHPNPGPRAWIPPLPNPAPDGAGASAGESGWLRGRDPPPQTQGWDQWLGVGPGREARTA